MIRLEKTIVAGSMALLLAGTSFFMPQNKAMAARTIKIDVPASSNAILPATIVFSSLIIKTLPS